MERTHARLWESKISLGKSYEIISTPYHVDMNTLTAMKLSAGDVAGLSDLRGLLKVEQMARLQATCSTENPGSYNARDQENRQMKAVAAELKKIMA